MTGYKRGFKSAVAPAEAKPLQDTNCVFCGQCVNVCPTAALTEINYIKKVWAAINDPSKKVIVQAAPAVRVGLGEEFDVSNDVDFTGKMVSGLKKLGFDAVFDTNFAADLTIMEEAHEVYRKI